MEALKINGWNVFYNKNHSNIVDLRFSVLAGSEKEEVSGIYGVAHFAEHLLFKGTKKRNYLDINDEIAALGGQSNAFTSKSVVSYYIRVIQMNWEKSFEILADMFFNSVLDEKEIEKERNVILEEAKSGIDDHETFIMEEGLLDYISPARGHRIIGTFESIASITRKEILQFIESHYKGDNVLISVSGNVEKYDLIKILTANLPEIGRDEKVISVEKDNGLNNKKLSLNRENLEQAYSLLFYRGFGRKDPNYNVQKILLNGLGGGVHSLLYKKIREEFGLCYHIDAGEVASFIDTSLVCVSSNLTKKNIDKVVGIGMDIIEDIKREGFDEKLLNISKVDYTSYLAMSTETSTGYVMYYGINYLFDSYENFEEIYSSLHSVTNDQVIEVANHIFNHPKEIILS